MIFENLLSLATPTNVLVFTAVLVCAALLRNRYGYGISSIPGPFLASFTDLHRLILVYGRKPEKEHIRLHQEHGQLVRLGPNNVSVTNLQAIKEIYGLNKGYCKSIARGKPVEGMFNTTNDTFHAKLRRHTSNAYAMSTLLQFEPLVDSTSTAFLQALDERYASTGRTCDFGQWLQWYAFDVIGELTFSQRLGFIDRAEDVEGIIQKVEEHLDCVSVAGQIPLLDKIWRKNPIKLWLSAHGYLTASSPVVAFTQKQMSLRSSEPKQKTTDRRDFMARFMEAGEKAPEFMTPGMVLSSTFSNINAGSDTTAISLRAVFYNLLKNPVCYAKLMSELESAPKDPSGLMSFTVAKDLPYLDAVMKEALRIHPAVGLTLERTVPACGLQIGNTFIPAGTTVGTSAWALHHNSSIFGPNPERFIPERWIERSGEDKATMNGAMFSFGMGSRTCVEKNISLLEMYKVVPAVLRRFALKLEDERREWKTHNAWFVKQTDFYVKLARRT